MSSSGLWAIGALADADVATFHDRFNARIAGHRSRPQSAVDWTWWHDSTETTSLFTVSADHPETPLPTADAHRLVGLAHSMPLDEPDAGDLIDECWATWADPTIVEPFVMVTRKASPVAALYYAIGPRRAGLLPGWFGNLLLTADQVPAALRDGQRALTLTGGERADVVTRIREWISAFGDDPDTSPDDLLDEPLRILQNAAELGYGVAGVTRWY